MSLFKYWMYIHITALYFCNLKYCMESKYNIEQIVMLINKNTFWCTNPHASPFTHTTTLTVLLPASTNLEKHVRATNEGVSAFP